MNKQEFLLSQSSDLIELYKKHKSYTTTFTVLYDDGTTESFATQFNGQISKENFNYFMRKICTYPRVIASVFISEGWTSASAGKENKRPSQSSDREKAIMLIYCSRENERELNLYKPDKNGNLELTLNSSAHSGRFANPFEVPCLSNTEKDKLTNDFQEDVCNAVCHAFKESQTTFPALFFLTDTPERLDFRVITEEEWANRNLLKQKIISRCNESQTIAFILVSPENDLVSFIRVSERINDISNYRIDPVTYTMKLEERKSYKGEFSNLIKGDYLSVVLDRIIAGNNI